MGNFRIEIDAVGGHGCQREIGDGETVTQWCGQSSCPDCKARAFVADLKSTGNSIAKATLTHWPGMPSQVQDDLLSGKRTGSFGK